MSKVRSLIRMLTYLTKQGIPQLIHNYPRHFLEHLQKHSFEKKISMTVAISKLKERVYLSQIDLEEYIYMYRVIRNGYKKPDPNWYKEYDRMQELSTSEETMKIQISDFISQKKSGYY